ncbi:olfactory receptor 14I1-like [Eublepharis macularius]|uniref:Olfactory receptor n=1 Tax=Eublepharis macularius TaxID=481883 RepID=A0AA97LBT4_EUBMA|nr:olfactory receptor 14I1-like [Eublepharis macularius]
MSNATAESDFLLLEFSDVRQLQFLHFTVFLMLYLATVTGNLLVISSVASDHHLHTPMYFLLMNLAMQDLGQISVTIPKSMINSLLNTRLISYSGCVAQVFFFSFFGVSDFCLLTVMAYDRYVAICNPLHYEMVINRQACIEMIAGVWIAGFLYAGINTCGTFATHFCSNAVNQFFCEIPQLIKLSCSGLNVVEMSSIGIALILSLGCFIYILVTYAQIFSTVFKVPSAKGRQKAFSTCVPHLFVCSIFILTGSFAYLKPAYHTSSELDLIFGIIYSLVPPILNPVIYSIRNKEIKQGMAKVLGFRVISLNT